MARRHAHGSNGSGSGSEEGGGAVSPRLSRSYSSYEDLKNIRSSVSLYLASNRLYKRIFLVIFGLFASLFLLVFLEGIARVITGVPSQAIPQPALGPNWVENRKRASNAVTPRAPPVKPTTLPNTKNTKKRSSTTNGPGANGNENEPTHRILIVTGAYNHIVDGVALTLNRLTDYLLRKGHDALIIAPTTAVPALRHVGNLLPVPSIAAPFRSDYRMSLGLTTAVAKVVSDFDPTIVHIATPDILGFQAQSWAIERDLPVVCSYHTRFNTYLKYYNLAMMEGLLWSIFGSFYSKCRHIYVPSYTVRDELSEHIANMRPDALKFWLRGVDSQLFHPMRRSREWRRAMLGISHVPDLETNTQAAAAEEDAEAEADGEDEEAAAAAEAEAAAAAAAAAATGGESASRRLADSGEIRRRQRRRRQLLGKPEKKKKTEAAHTEDAEDFLDQDDYTSRAMEKGVDEIASMTASLGELPLSSSSLSSSANGLTSNGESNSGGVGGTPSFYYSSSNAWSNALHSFFGGGGSTAGSSDAAGSLSSTAAGSDDGNGADDADGNEIAAPPVSAHPMPPPFASQGSFLLASASSSSTGDDETSDTAAEVSINAAPAGVFIPSHHHAAQTSAFMAASMKRRKIKPGSVPIVLLVSRIVWEKALDVFVDVVTELERRGVNHASAVVGDGPALDQMRRLLPNTQFLGRLRGTRLAMAYASADLLLFPSRSETFGTVILEALASGIPVVAAEGASSMIIRNGTDGYVLPPDDRSSFVHHTEMLLRNHDKRRFLGKQGRARASSEFQWDSVLETLMGHYKELADEVDSHHSGVGANVKRALRSILRL